MVVTIDMGEVERKVVALINRAVDVYKFRAARIFGVPIEHVTKEQRTDAKRRTYLANYVEGREFRVGVLFPNEEADAIEEQGGCA